MDFQWLSTSNLSIPWPKAKNLKCMRVCVMWTSVENDSKVELFCFLSSNFVRQQENKTIFPFHSPILFISVQFINVPWTMLKRVWRFWIVDIFIFVTLNLFMDLINSNFLRNRWKKDHQFRVVACLCWAAGIFASGGQSCGLLPTRSQWAGS